MASCGQAGIDAIAQPEGGGARVSGRFVCGPRDLLDQPATHRLLADDGAEADGVGELKRAVGAITSAARHLDALPRVFSELAHTTVTADPKHDKDAPSVPITEWAVTLPDV